MAVIELAPGVFASLDDEDLSFVAGRRWRLRQTMTPCGRVYRYASAGRSLLMHRLLMGASPGVFVDHIDGDGLNNRRSNLRLCTHAENMRNRRINANHAHGFKGVGVKPSGNYYAAIKAGRTRRSKGGFATPEAAADCYAAMARELHGAFARTAQTDLTPEPAAAQGA